MVGGREKTKIKRGPWEEKECMRAGEREEHGRCRMEKVKSKRAGVWQMNSLQCWALLVLLSPCSPVTYHLSPGSLVRDLRVIWDNSVLRLQEEEDFLFQANSLLLLPSARVTYKDSSHNCWTCEGGVNHKTCIFSFMYWICWNPVLCCPWGQT